MNTLTAILIVFLVAFVAEKVVLVLSRVFGLFAIVQERTCRVYVLFGKVIGILDEPGLHILPFKIGPAAFVINFFGTCQDRKSTRLNSSHLVISYAVFCLKKK